MRAKASEFGLTEAEINILVGSGLTSLSKIAYAVTTPGVNPTDDQLKLLLDSVAPDTVTLGSLSSMRQLMFEAQTMCIHAVRNQIENTETSKRPELGHAEKQARITNQKKQLAGYDLSGPLECSHASYDLVGEMLQKDSVTYLSPTKFGTRASEVTREKPPKEVVIGSGAQLTVTAGQRDD